ncbi:MAG: hypothetical protein KZQ98_17785 [Candidatus Thiodiazotropha sp. (ex Lucinoma borealis)]|nr:hypothetical protein [Candidatus Thiodiazotropha sp. (ex Lucinoma borealis)]
MGLHSSDIENQISNLNTAITEAEEIHRELSFRFAEGEAVQEQMIEQRGRVDYFKGVIRDHEAALQYALQKEASEHDESAIQQILDDVEAGKQLLDKRVAIAKKLDKQFAALGRVMDEYIAVSDEVRAQHSGLLEADSYYGFWGSSLFNGVPQLFGWQNAIKKAGLVELVKSEYGNLNDHFEGATLEGCILKQHEQLRYMKKVQLVLDQQEEATDV